MKIDEDDEDDDSRGGGGGGGGALLTREAVSSDKLADIWPKHFGSKTI